MVGSPRHPHEFESYRSHGVRDSPEKTKTQIKTTVRPPFIATARQDIFYNFGLERTKRRCLQQRRRTRQKPVQQRHQSRNVGENSSSCDDDNNGNNTHDHIHTYTGSTIGKNTRTQSWRLAWRPHTYEPLLPTQGHRPHTNLNRLGLG